MLILGNNIEELKKLEENSIDSCVTDPPYGIKFMGKKWDYDIPSVEQFELIKTVLKPGSHILVACGTRTQHRMVCNIENAGFEIRDVIVWVYSQGFPKSLNIGKAIDKKFGNERVEEDYIHPNTNSTVTNKQDDPYFNGKARGKNKISIGKTEWEGWGTGLKPGVEFFTLARKPISEKNIVDNVLKWGTGGINIDDCRVPINGDPYKDGFRKGDYTFKADASSYKPRKDGDAYRKDPNKGGRYPANVIHDGSDEVVGNFPITKSGKLTSKHKRHTDISPNGIYGKFDINHPFQDTYGNEGSASRFFYCAKANQKDRDSRVGSIKNNHPTVKPIKLMKYLVKLITPTNGIVIDPFMGSGSTGVACKILNIDFVGIEIDAHYFDIAKQRIEVVETQQELF